MTAPRKKGYVAVALGKATKGRPETGSVQVARSGQRDESQVGVALRAAYKSALDEVIPTEMLDLLSKLK